MAIPTSGSLSMLKMAREAKHGDHDGSQSMGTISMYDMMNGGNTNGSTVSYPSINTNASPNPTTGTNSANVVTNIERYSGSTFTDVAPVYFSGTGGVNTILYTTPCATNSTLSAGTYITDVATFGCTSEDSGCATGLTVDSTGKITAVDCYLCF